MPAGLLDVAGEDPVETAPRELAEEAGLAADEWSVLMDVAPSPGFSDESVRVFLARGLHRRRPARSSARTTRRPTSRPAGSRCTDAVAMVLAGTIVNGSCVAAVLAAHAVRAGTARTRPADAPWPDRPTRFAARKG